MVLGTRRGEYFMRQLPSQVSAAIAVKVGLLMMTTWRSLATIAAATTLLILAMPDVLGAHGVSGKDAVFLQSIQGAAIGPLMYLGAKHMVTGYDHLAFLVGVIFFLYRLKDIVQYVSLFTSPA